MRLHAIRLRMIVLTIALAWLAGTLVSEKPAWPFMLLTEGRYAFLDATLPRPSASRPVVFDRFGRLNGYHGKSTLACPRQGARTAVLLIIGQSNSANSGEGRQISAHGDKIVNLFQGKCYQADSPLLGASGAEGEAWTLLANRLVASGRYDRVVLISSGIDGSGMARWQTGGNLNRMLLRVLDSAQAQYGITHVLWHQGEADYALGTSEESYRRMFLSLVSDFRGRGINAPVFISVASRCGSDSKHVADNPVVRAQRSLPDPAQNLHPGPDTDALIGANLRNACHFTAAGLEIFAASWESALIGGGHRIRPGQ